MANIGGFEVEDDVQDTSTANAIGGFEIEETPPENDSQNVPKKDFTWEEGDGGVATLPDGQKNEWGGNLRNEGRKVLLRRDKDGKVNGYSTTSSMIVRDPDGKMSVIPTVVDGKEMTPDEAVRHYEQTGEHWGKADDEDSAREMAASVHENHASENERAWNNYIHSHWDEMSDEIKNNPGVRYWHKRRNLEDVSDMVRLAFGDTEDAVKEWKSGFDYEEEYDSMGLPVAREKVSRADRPDEDALAAIAKRAGIPDWQIERVRKNSANADEMRKNLAYIAGNRVSGSDDEKKDDGSKLTKYIRSVTGGVTHAIADRIPDVTRLAGTLLGGERDAEKPEMVDDPYSRKENEDVRQWARRKNIHLNRKNFDSWNEFFKWEAPIEGKEGMRESQSLMNKNRKSWSEKSIGDKLVAIADQEQADIERLVPRHLTDNPVMNFVEDTTSGIGGFVFAGSAMIPMTAANSYQNTREEAARSGMSENEARGIGAAMGAFDAGMTAAFYSAPVRKWMKAKGIRPVETFKSGSYTDMRRSFGNYFAKQALIDQSAAALEAGAILGVQGAGDRLGEMVSKGEKIDIGDIVITGIEGAGEGLAVGLVMGGAHILGARHAGRKHYDKLVRDAIKTPEGVAAMARINPYGTASFCESFERGSMPGPKEVDAAGLPPMSAQERVNYYKTLKSLGITSDSFRTDAKRIGDAVQSEGTAGGVSPTPEIPPSLDLSERIRGMGQEPVKFQIPQDAEGKPKFTTMAWRDNKTGKEGKNRIAVDPQTNVAIMDNGDGTFTSYDNLQNAVDSHSLSEAIENANELALAQQYNDIERQKKTQVIQNECATNFGNKNVLAFPTMGDAVRQISAAEKTGTPILGIRSAASFTNPANGFRFDRKAFHTPDGTTVLILDNIDSPEEVRRLLRHEIVGHGGPNSEFGEGVDSFLSSLDSQEMTARRQKLIEQGMTPEMVDSPRGRREIFANMLQERAHNPTIKQKIASWLNERARKIGAKKTYSDADIEVIASRWEKEARGTDGSLDLREPGDRFEFIELDGDTPSETRENAPVSAPEEKPITSRPPEEKPVEKPEQAETNVSKPVGERNIVEKLTDKAEAQELPLSEIEVSDSRIPQFKENADPVTGEVEPLTGEPYDLVSNPIVVMEFKDGKKVVVTGRHRYGLYKRSGRKTIAARVIREADGWSVKDAMAIDAIGNIIDEKGTEKDYVKYFDEAKPTRNEAKDAGFLDRPKGQRAFSIYEGATADTKQLIDWEGSGGDGKISVDQAGIISESAPKDAHPRFGAVQRILTQKALGGLRGKKLGILARAIAEEAKTRKDVPNVGGEMQLDLFTSEEDQALLAMEDKRADYRVKKAGEYSRIAVVLRTAVSKGGKLDLNGEYAKELGITDPKDKRQLIAARDKAIERANYWENAVTLDEADKTAMDAEITAKSDADAAKREAIQKKAEEKLAAVKEKRTGSKADSKDAEKPTKVVNKEAEKPVATEKKPVETAKTDTLTETEKTRAAANAAFTAMTGIPVVQVGDNGKVVSDSTPVADKVIGGSKSADDARQKMRATSEKAKKARADFASLFNSPEFDPNVEKYLDWTEKYNLQPFKKKHIKDFTSRNGIDFNSPEFDPETMKKRRDAMEGVITAYIEDGVATFEDVARDLYAEYPDKFENIKPYLRRFWNFYAEDYKLDEISKEQAEQIFGTILNAKESDNGNSRSTGEQNGAVLDAVSPADVTQASEGEPAGAASRSDGEVKPVDGVRDGGERDAAGQPVVGHDVVGTAERVSAGEGDSGQGDAKESVAAPEDASAVSDRGRAQKSEPRVRLEPGDTDRIQARVKEAATKASPEKPSNYVITAEDEAWLNNSSPGEKVANNMAVIKLLSSLAEDGRLPTAEERTMMARYVGFGGFPQIVDQKYKDAFKNYGDIPSSELPVQTQAALKKLRFGLKGFDTYREMRQYLTEDDFNSIRQAMIDAFYTPIDVCRSMHNALKAAGFNGGRMLETSAGVGNMVGTGSYDSVPHWTAVELDKTTGKILEYLYPEANVKIQGFQEVLIPHNFIDATISNVPFSNDIKPYDPEYAKYSFNLHDYFFAKTVDVLRPGGVAALISSTGTLDKIDKSLLRFMDEHGGQIVGALRLPNGHQAKNSGTDVAADIIFIQKVNGNADNSAFMRNGDLIVKKEGGGTASFRINDYFVQHPEMIFGTPTHSKYGMYGRQENGSVVYKATRDPSEIDAAIRKAAEGLKYLAPNENPITDPIDLDADETGLRRGNIGIIGGRIVKREGDIVVPLDIDRLTKKIKSADGKTHNPLWPESLTKKGLTLEKAVHDVVRLRNAYHEYVEAQKGSDEESVALKRSALNAVYDVMISRYKHLNEGPIAKVFDMDDADGIILQNLESYDMVPDGLTKAGKPKFKMTNFRKSDALLKRTLFRSSKADRADNVLDGLRISLNECGTVNLARIAELTGRTKESVSADLMSSGHVFQNPSTGGLETRDEYLSGSVRRKLREAKAAADVDPSFKKNIDELEKVQPADKPATQIKYQLGQKFIPNDLYKQFLAERVFGSPDSPAGRVTVGFDEKRDSWLIAGEGTNAFWHRKCPDGTSLDKILIKIFNGSSLTVKDRIGDGDGKYHYVTNPQKTQAVEALRDDLTAELSKWMVGTPERAKRIERAYNDVMNDNVERQFDTSLLTLDGISDEWAKKVNTPGYEHQKRSITRGVLNGNLYIQHCVGAGKSFEMFSIIMQRRRLGLSRKPMLTVPNHMVESGQVLREFKEAYPGAKILVATTKDLNSKNRRKFLAKAANGDWDCIVVPHSSFSLIGIDPKVQAEYIRQEIEDLREMMEASAAEGKRKGNAEKRIEKKIAAKMEKMKKLLDQSKKDSTVPFETIGVDLLLVDEAHNFKGLDITTKMSNVSGVTGSVSQRAQDLEMKCRYLSKLHGGDKGVVFASGTAISNSISESYTNSRFMVPSKMREMGIYRFDDWAKSFGVVETKAAPRASGKGYQEKTRFSRFQNLIELKQVNFSYSDVVLDSDLAIPRPTMETGKPIVHKIPATDFQKKYVESLDKRLDSFKGKFDPKVDNPLKVVTEGRLLAIDPALLGLKDEHRRLDTIADNVFDIWKKSTGITGKDGKTILDGTQLIFCDSGVPKPKKFSKVVRTEDGGFATKSGNFWTFYVSDVDANGMRHGKAVRSDGATFSLKPIADHAQNGIEDISTVYAAFEEMAQAAAEYSKSNKMSGSTHAKDPIGEPFDINGWIDANAEQVGYDIRFENPYAVERVDAPDFDEIDENSEEEIVDEDSEDENAPEKDQDEANNGDVAVENMLRGKFNIYSYIKNALVKRGVPAEDIVFIHDAEDARAKRAMFEKFNADATNYRGGPRILIGNTPKMGEGANVQRRLVAIHNADVPWKPAWLTQRDGRGIRAGNLNATIGIHRYVTENTFDVYSYDKVSSKQQFINQVQSHEMTDEVEDIDDAVLSAEEAKAAAAGPIGRYMMAKTRLEQSIRKSELTLANQQEDIFNAQAGLEWDEQSLQAANKALEDDKAMIDKYNAAKGDKPFGLEVIDDSMPEFGKTLTENDELQQFLMKKVNEFVRKGSEDGMVGKLYGMPVWWKEHRGQDMGQFIIGQIKMKSPAIPIINRTAPIAKSTVSTFKAAVTQATSEKVLDADRAKVASAEKRFAASKDALTKLSVDETLSDKIDDMKIELAQTLNILGAKDAGVQAAAKSILEKRIADGRDVEKSKAILDDLSKKNETDKALVEADQEAQKVEFDSPEFNPDADKPPKAEDDKKFGFTNEEVAFALKTAGMEPPKHVTKPDEMVERQADALLSNREYMKKLAHAVYQKNRATRDYENLALGIYTEQCKDALNTAKSAHDEMVKMLEDLPGDTDPETVDILKRKIKELKVELIGAQKDFREAAGAKIGGASEQGRALRSNRMLVDGTDYSYAGIRGMIESELGGKPVSAEMDAEIGKLAENFKDLDEKSRSLAVERIKAFSKKVVEDLKRVGKERGSGSKAAGNELKRVMRNYEDALTQIQVHADEAGGTLIGLSDQLYPSWGKWLKAIGEYHCFMNPDVDEQGVIDAIREDVGRYLEDGIDETTIRDILTGFGHNYRQSRYDSQRKMNDLKAQALSKRQRDYMIENGKLPPQTGMVRDDPSDETRALRKEVQQLKKDIDEQEGGPRALKGALSSAKTRMRNSIADLERAIANGEKIERSHRTLMEDAELQMLKRRRDELREQYDAIFGEKATLTDEQRRERAEKALRKVLERTLERLGRAYGGDFSAPVRASRIDSPTIQSLREEIAQTNRTIQDLKDAAYPNGTPEEIAKKNARRMEARQEAIQRMQARIISGDIRPNVKKAPPMPPEMQARYDAMGKELKRAHDKLRQLRQEAKDSLKPAWLRRVGEAWRFMDGVQKMAMASLDFTQVGNQTGSIAVGHPSVAYKSFMQSIPAFLNETNAEALDNELLSDPLVKEAVDNKWLAWKKAGEFAENRGDRVEFFDAIDRGFKIGGRILRLTDVPLYGTAIANSDRLYASYINTAAANLYSLILKDTGLFPKGASSFEKRVVGDMVNVMTGSGTISKQTRAVLGKIMWAPGLVDSQFKRAFGYTMLHPFFADASEDGSGTFKERAKLSYIGAKEFVRSHIGAMLLGGMLLAIFGSSDEKYKFWKSSKVQKLIMLMSPRIGHTQLDFTGGEVAFYRLAEKLITGIKETGSGRHAPIRDYFGEIAHFMQGRINPFIGNIFYRFAGKDYAGSDYGTLEMIASFAPISIKEAGKSIYENGVQDGNWCAAATAATLVMFGIGKGTYRKDDYRILSNRFRENYKEMMDVVNDPLLTDADKKEMISTMVKSNRLLDPNNAGAIMNAVRTVDSEENKIEKMKQKLDIKEAKDGSEDTDIRYQLDRAQMRLDQAKDEVIRLIRERR